MAKTPFLVVGVLSVAASIVIACGSNGDDSTFGDGGASSSSGASNGSSSFGSSGLPDGSSGSSGNGDGAACSAPVDMYIMFDRSGSMGADCNIGSNGTSKWCRSVNALSGYFNGQGAAGQAAAIQFFPVDSQADPGQSDPKCTTGATYDTPALPASGYTDLPSNSFDALLNSTKPAQNGGTPTEGAIRGLTKWTAANRRPGRVTIGILITDGDPNGCDTNLDNLKNLLDAHYQATKIRTYVIGMTGATFANLEKMAIGGNGPAHPATVGTITGACGTGGGAVTAPCHFWNVGDGDPAVFTAALAAIQDSADGCKDGGGYVNPVN